jgi:mono/diheme cytochrome c family protein
MGSTDDRHSAPESPNVGRPLPRPVGDGGVPEAGGLDLQPDVERIHRTIQREPRDPVEGREPVPWFFTAVIALSLFWGGWYLGRYGGEFGTATHVAFASRQAGIAAAAAGQEAGAVANPIVAGKAVYEKNCQVCHQAVGQGVPGAFPPVVGSEWVTGSPETLVRILLNGLQGPVEVAGTTYNGAMPAWRDVLADAEIAAVATYVRQLEANEAPPVPPDVVVAVRGGTASRATPWTAPELQAAAANKGTGGPP